ncbi:hypothetical protein Barb7_02221 [Bacteroidales bacterium Barb7]|nr:hypothetical protein Barb7_02221 [Bacteroidales bacterium Barb7]
MPAIVASPVASNPRAKSIDTTTPSSVKTTLYASMLAIAIDIKSAPDSANPVIANAPNCTPISSSGKLSITSTLISSMIKAVEVSR